MKFLDSTYLHGAPVGLGLGLQPCALVGFHSGSVRDRATGEVTASRWMLEDRNPDNSFIPASLDKAYPSNFWEVLAATLTPMPKGGWAILDAEGAASYQVWCEWDANHQVNAAHNAQAMTNWERYIKCARVLRPDLKIAPILQWYAPDGSNWRGNVSWGDVLACDKQFRDRINPYIDALCLECYYRDYAAPPADAAGDGFNWQGSADLRLGFRDHVHQLHTWARTISGKPPVHLFSIANEWGSNPATQDFALSGPRMGACLDLIASYQPAAIGLWGVAARENTFRNPDGWEVGTFDPAAPWLAEVARRVANNRA